jgi:hypothetical protein
MFVYRQKTTKTVIPERLYRESSVFDFYINKSCWIPAGACPSMIQAGAGMTINIIFGCGRRPISVFDYLR